MGKKFLKGQPEPERQQRENYWKEKEWWSSYIPEPFIKIGRQVSVNSKWVWATINWYNPAYPSIEQIAVDVGISTSAVEYSFYELEEKRLIRRTSGKRHHTNNQFEICHSSEWEFTRPVLSPSKLREARKRTRMMDQLHISLLKVWDRFDDYLAGQGSTTPLSRVVATPLNGEELYESETRPTNQPISLRYAAVETFMSRNKLSNLLN